MGLDVGLRGHVARIVTDEDTAPALGSGDVPVLATPRLLAWAEAATMAALNGRLVAGATSVGSRVEFEHREASAVGATVTVTAELVAIDGNLLHFSVAAHDEDEHTVATGEVVRVVVERERFLARFGPR